MLSAALDVAVDVEDRHVQRDDHSTDENTDDRDHDGLDERRELFGHRLDLLVVEVADLASMVSSAPESSPTAIICVTMDGEQRLLGERLRDRLALSHGLADLVERLLDDPVVGTAPTIVRTGGSEHRRPSSWRGCA